MKKITIILALGFLLLLGSEAGAQFATVMDSSDVAGWKFTTFTDVDDSLKAGYQIYQKIDSTDAVIDSAVGAERAAVAASVDEAASSVWAGRVSDETGTGLWVYGTSPTFTTDITSPLVIGGTATTSDLSLKTTSGVGATGADMHFLVGNNGATEAMTILNGGKVGVGINSPSSAFHIKANIPGTVGSHPAGQLIIQNPSTNTVSNVVITGYNSDGNGNPDQQLWYLGSASGSTTCLTLLNRRNSELFLGTNSTTRMTIAGGDGNVGIGTLSPPERLSVVGNIATGDSTTGDVDVFHYFSTDGSWVTEYLKWDDGNGRFEFSDNLYVVADLVAENAYHVTSAEADSQFMSKGYIDATAGGLVAQSVKGDHVDSTAEDFVFADPYRGTSAEAESLLLTHGGASASYQPLEATLTDIADGTINENLVNTANPWAVNEGGTGAATFTDGGILLGSGTGAITALGVATNGQIPIGDGTTDPVLATITGGTGITVTNGVGTISAALTVNTIDSTFLMPDCILDSELGADAVDEGNIADDGIDSEHYNDGSIDLVHIAAAAYAKDIVTTAPVTGATDNVLVGADGDITIALDFTASWNFGGAAGFEIPAVDNPTTDAEGEIAWDTNDDAIEVYMGDETESALIPAYQKLDAHIFAPDGVNDEIAIFHVDALLYPFGIEVDQVSITLSEDAIYAMPFEEWAGDPPVWQSLIDSVVTIVTESYKEDGTPVDGAIDADDYIYLDIPATNVDWIHVQIIYHVNPGN